MPHEPPIFDASRGKLTVFRPGLGYRDNLALADQTLAKIVAAMRTAGVWQSTTLVVNSDHGWRGLNGYAPDATSAVPLFVKLPGQHRGVVDARELDALTIHPLLKALLAGELTEHNSLTAWMDAASE